MLVAAPGDAMFSMSQIIIGIVSIVAIILSPIIALRVQTALEKRRDATNRKLAIFKTLMTYRATPLSPYFVQALNLIDVEFSANSEKPVREAWKVLLDHLSTWATSAEPLLPFRRLQTKKARR